MNVSAHPQAGGKWITQVKSMGHSPEAEAIGLTWCQGSIQVNDGRDRSPHTWLAPVPGQSWGCHSSELGDT